MKKLLGIDLSNIRGDMFGGITAGIVALPLALAFGVSSGLGASAGLYGAIFISFFAALFGGTNTQISGPTAPMTAVSMIIIADMISKFNGNVSDALPYILIIFFLAGIFEILLGVFKVGVFIKYIPYPVVSGFMSAIGLIILITQISPTIGYYGANSSGVIGNLKIIPTLFDKINWLELILSLSTVAVIYSFKRVTTLIPSSLVALVLVSSVAVLFNLDYVKIEAIPEGLPLPHFDIFNSIDLNLITPFIVTSLSLALLGAIDSLLTSVVADNLTKTEHKPNKELVGQGIGNGIAALFGGLPGAGATIRTVVNIDAGGKTKLSGMIAGLLLFVILLFFSSTASQIPAAVLSGILITVGIGVMDYKGLKAIPKMPFSEVSILIIVLLLSTFWNLIYAVLLGVVISCIIFMKKLSDLTVDESKCYPLTSDSKELNQKTFVVEIKGPLFFGSAKYLNKLFANIPEGISNIIIKMDEVSYIDQSGIYALETVLDDLKAENKIFALVNTKEKVKSMLHKVNTIPDFLLDKEMFASDEECINYIKEKM